MPGLNPDRQIHLALRSYRTRPCPASSPHPLSHRRANQTAIVPGDFAHRLGKFLQPGVVGETAVVDRRIEAEVDFDGLRVETRGLCSISASSENLLGRICGIRRQIHHAASGARIHRNRRRSAAPASNAAQSRDRWPAACPIAPPLGHASSCRHTRGAIKG